MEKEKAQYDACAKRILSQKIILAHILSKCVKEFNGVDIKEIANNIEGEASINVLIDQDLTNKRIVGINNEDLSINEGLVRFDIVFYVKLNDNKTKIIINIEAQKEEPHKYEILNRAIFYVSRLISSQKDRDFLNSNYDDIKQVYSIWICMNMSDNSLSHYHLTKDEILKPYNWKGNIDLLNIILIGITNDIPDYNDYYDMHRLLGTLFSSKLNTSEKLSIIKQEYDIPVDDKLRKDVNVMCNLGEGIEERAIERTTKAVTEKVTKEVTEKVTKEVTMEVTKEVTQEVTKEMNEKFVMNMYELGYTYVQISDVTKLDINDVKDIVNKKGFN